MCVSDCHLQVNGQCCEDNPDALTHHELLLPGHLLLKFFKEKLEDCLQVLQDAIAKRLEGHPDTDLKVCPCTLCVCSLCMCMRACVFPVYVCVFAM